MTNTKKNKRWLSLLVAMMVIMSFSLSTVLAASPKKKTFVIRQSGSYAAIGSVTITASGNSVDTSKTGTIRFNDAVQVVWATTCQYIPAGAIYNYSISSMKEGSRITLTRVGTIPNAPATLTGKIHISGSTLWKIDSFGCGFYFRDT